MKIKKDTYELIWQTVKQIPKGKVATYGQVAELSGLKNQARLVGYALHSLADNTKIPWQRVINSKGKVSFPPNSKIYRLQKSLLGKEGIKFMNDRIDMKIFGWMGYLQTEWKSK
jgi:methylated-DNA-protein-cysteine methyltransferase-like protein